MNIIASLILFVIVHQVTYAGLLYMYGQDFMYGLMTRTEYNELEKKARYISMFFATAIEVLYLDYMNWFR